MNQYLIYVIPVFLFFVFFEMIADAITHKKSYRFEDTITNISLGVGQQIIEALVKTVFSFLFLRVYQYSIFKIPDTVVSFLAVIVICDFIFYWFHRFSHTINFLWAIHIVHHQSSEFNLTVSLRQPWLHKIAAFAFFLVLPLLGVSPRTMILALALQTFYQFWLHTRFIGKLGILEKVMVSPSHHRVHHGMNEKYLNKNYGNTFIIWDRLFGTFQAEEEAVIFGTTRPFQSTNPVWANVYYWKELLKSTKNQRGFMNKCRAFIQRPDSSLQEKEGIIKTGSSNLSLSVWIYGYLICQYVVIFAAAIFFLHKQDSFSFLFKIIGAIFIIWSIYNFSALMQRKRNSILFEMLRIVILCLLVFLFLNSASLKINFFSG